MTHSFDFPIKHVYPDREPGISIAVLVTYGDRTEKISAKFDPGAEFCVFTHDVALLLDLPLETGLRKTFDTSGGLVETYGHEIAFNSFGHEHSAIVFFAATPGHRRNLLGRQGWIRNFGIALFDNESVMYMRPVI
jgi:hypothetical protein